MAASRRAAKRSSEGVGWLATLAGAALLIVAGFGVGLVAGTVFEEPELVMEHLAGNTTEVPLAEAPPPELEGGSHRLASSPPAAPAPVAAAPRSQSPRPGGFAIQVGAFASEASARELATELKRLGMPSYVEDEPGGARYKVRVGPLETREEATRLARLLKTERRLPTWVFSREP